jgi:hypothetical protein
LLDPNALADLPPLAWAWTVLEGTKLRRQWRGADQLIVEGRLSVGVNERERSRIERKI